jgi:hypothetical protein
MFQARIRAIRCDRDSVYEFRETRKAPPPSDHPRDIAYRGKYQAAMILTREDIRNSEYTVDILTFCTERLIMSPG